MSSAVLQTLKSVKERLPDNYTSGQLFEVLDRMLYRSIDPIIEHANYVDRILAIVLSWYSNNQRRKVSPLSKERFNTYVIAFLGARDNDLRKKIYRNLRLERNITFFIVQRWLSLLKPWRQLHVQYARGDNSVLHQMASLERTALIWNNHNLFTEYQNVAYWHEQAAQFKQQMLEKYMRFIMREAYGYYRAQQINNPHLRFDLDEIAQNFILAAYKAIDKCDERQGTLTTYIQNWLKNAKVSTHFRHEYGIAYNIPHSKRQRIAKKQDHSSNIYVSIDSEEAQEIASEHDLEQEMERNDQINFVRMLAKIADPIGIGRIVLGIGEVLDEHEVNKLKGIAVRTRATL